ncbi:ABC transporter ATP-binding protein [Clostridium cylindrosporum]|uniref:ABC-type multidrug transport system, ATPase component n=1 Tax=Clostridium cylindrosporum DSM 605 TaxID=1121307 RepID=A0A0J8G3S3_CLOCY|nr:ABC transporter ATP-binding protein [Clostridium cylindrosporum]KMT22361.1 ABC-type multidrug transport system, ATPase component [Clostridium cylindrosporum DSM 605]
MGNIIEIKNLTKSYGRQRGIVNVNLTVEEGDIFGFIGPNGAGKSTTIRTLLGLIYPTSGSAEIFGKDCIKFSKDILKEVGYLPSEVFYYDNMKVIDLLNYSASFYAKDCKDRIKELSDILELDLKRKISDLSYGNKKKVGIVQGLIHSPKLIILDEPTGGLDPLMQQKFFNLIREENKKGATILFSSHILSEVQHICNKVAIIKDGKIIKTEKISTLRENTYKKISVDAVGNIDNDYFKIKGVENLKVNKNNAKFLYSGNVNVIMKLISELELYNVFIEEPDLEELFMHYYK